MKRRTIIITALLCLVTVIVCAPVVYTFVSTRGDRYTAQQINSVPPKTAALVFGAGINPDGTPTPYLQNRITTAVLLYKANKVDTLLMSGDNSTEHHNEPVVMKRAAIKQGVPGKDIVVDYAGFNTYDSCYRAKAIFGLSEATLVTQAYHLPRAMVTCQDTGVQNIGVAAVSKSRDYTAAYLLREVLSTNKMMLQIATDPKPTVLGDPEPL